jgi:tight adherence protein C
MNLSPLTLGVGLLVSLSCGVTYWGLLKLRGAETPEQRLERLSAHPRPLEAAELELPLLDRVIRPWLRKQVRAAGRLTPRSNIEKLRINLVRAGHPYGWTILDFLGIKLLAGVISAIAIAYSQILSRASILTAILLTVVGGVVAYQLPSAWLTLRARRRRRALARALPDALDMLSICVDAGAGLDSAMLRISQKWKNELADEFGKVVAEIRVGLTRSEALKNLAHRTGVVEIGSFVAVLLQASEFGLSIVQVLHTQSEQMRTRRWQLAEEEARKVPIKLLFPLVFFIMPTLFAVTIGPAIPIVLNLFAQFLGG